MTDIIPVTRNTVLTMTGNFRLLLVLSRNRNKYVNVCVCLYKFQMVIYTMKLNKKDSEIS